MKDESRVVWERKKRHKTTWAIKTRRWFDKFNLRDPLTQSIAACVMLLVVAGSIWLTRTDILSKSTHLTATGELKTVLLADGSTVYLDTETRLNTIFSSDSRRIELEEGRALFAVLRDPDRPFIVTAGSIAVSALGTKFNVYKEKKGRITVAVSSGSVGISRKNQSYESGTEKEPVTPGKQPEPQEKKKADTSTRRPGLPQVILSSGQSVTIDEQETVHEIKTIDTKRGTSWRNGRLYFQRAPLSEIIDEINRYLENKIVIGDDRLKDIRISLNFDIKHRSSFLNALKDTIPSASHINSDGQTEITKREQ